MEDQGKAISTAQKQAENSIALEQAKYIQLKTEFEKYKAEMSENLNEAAAQNLSLQDQIDDLNEKIAMLSKARPGTPRDASSASAMPAAGNGAPVYSIGTPKPADDGSKKPEAEPISEIKTPAVLAQEAKEQLDRLLNQGKKDEPAVGNDKPPHLPLGSEVHSPTEPFKTPAETPKSVGKPQQQQIYGCF